MRILFVSEKCGFQGGVEQNIADCTALRQRGHECLLAYGQQSRDDKTYAALFDEVVPCAELGAADGLTVDALLDRLRPQALYLHKVPSVTPWLQAVARPGQLRPSMLRMIHDHDICCPRRHKYYAWNGRICKHPAGWRCYLDGAFVQRGTDGLELVSIAAKLREGRANFNMDMLIVNSQYMRAQLQHNGCPPQKIHLQHPCVTLTAPAQAPPPGRRVLYVGQLIRGKGVDLLLEAMRRVPNAILDVVGDGNAREALEKQAGERVHFHGFIESGRLRSFYQEAQVVAIPSRWPEPFGMVGLEAMQHARPVVAFDVGGISDWLIHEHTGLLIAEQDVAGFAGALTRVLDDPRWAFELGTHGHMMVGRRFSFDTYLDRLEHILTTTARQGDSQP